MSHQQPILDWKFMAKGFEGQICKASRRYYGLCVWEMYRLGFLQIFLKGIICNASVSLTKIINQFPI